MTANGTWLTACLAASLVSNVVLLVRLLLAVHRAAGRSPTFVEPSLQALAQASQCHGPDTPAGDLWTLRRESLDATAAGDDPITRLYRK